MTDEVEDSEIIKLWLDFFDKLDMEKMLEEAFPNHGFIRLTFNEED